MTLKVDPNTLHKPSTFPSLPLSLSLSFNLPPSLPPSLSHPLPSTLVYTLSLLTGYILLLSLLAGDYHYSHFSSRHHYSHFSLVVLLLALTSHWRFCCLVSLLTGDTTAAALTPHWRYCYSHFSLALPTALTSRWRLPLLSLLAGNTHCSHFSLAIPLLSLPWPSSSLPFEAEEM